MVLTKEEVSELQQMKKTRFPLSRIKRIIQQNEDVGKTSVTVPVVLSKSIELFFDRLIKSLKENADKRNSKKINTEDLKDVINDQEMYGFLAPVLNTKSDIE